MIIVLNIARYTYVHVLAKHGKFNVTLRGTYK